MNTFKSCAESQQRAATLIKGLEKMTRKSKRAATPLRNYPVIIAQ
jgi:hypothetical protein